MRKILLLISIGIFLSFFPKPVSAQRMMGSFQNPNPVVSETTTSSTKEDEAAGKAVWDKLQNKEVTCAGLTDDDFDILGDFFMGNMMGSNHASMNQLMSQRLGEDGEKQMHIAMGKRLSGCYETANFPQGAGYFMPMMGFSGTGMMNGSNTNYFGRGLFGMNAGATGSPFVLFHGLLWIAVLSFLITGSIFFLREIVRKKSK